MVDDQINTTSLPVTGDSLETLFKYIDTVPVDTSMMNDYDEVSTNCEIGKEVFNEQHMTFDNLNRNAEMEMETSVSRKNCFDNSETSPSSINSQSLDNNDEIPFYPQEWLIKDPVTNKIRPPKLYEFLRLVLNNSRYNSYASWLDANGLFKIHKPNEVANLWGKIKGRQTNHSMNYAALARCIRHYYSEGVMIPAPKRYTFRFANNK